ncbi:cell division protein SepF [Lolliginicoccus suaedae]|uniref:cell division protein SepF n=1 Tax=Lolliginicoccus suaedae TaxID=2605429 RepID=UPI0011ECFF85|nr:cell division protein SepF [Lolliginicoccus suaedae]
MSAMQKIKEYFALVPPAEYEDDYVDDVDQRGRGRRDLPPGRFDEPTGYRPGTYVPSQRRPEPAPFPPQGGFERDPYDRDRFGGDPRQMRPMAPPPAVEDFDRVQPPRPVAPPRRSEPDRRMAAPAEDVSVLAKITTLRPRDFSEARTIGEQFRDGIPVIMDLNDMPGADAKRVLDFAGGCAFALNGNFEKVASKVFLLSPADIDVSAEDRRRIAETSLNQGR